MLISTESPFSFQQAMRWWNTEKLLQAQSWVDVQDVHSAEAGHTFVAGDDGRFLALDSPSC